MLHDNLSRAEAIHRAILRHDCLIAVFAKKQSDGWTFRTCKVGQIMWSAATGSRKDYLNGSNGEPKLVGVYNPQARIDWIMDDLDYISDPKRSVSFRKFK